MPYDFDTPIQRRGTNCVKWAVEDHELPMWVGDMDFQTAPEITAAFQARAAHGVFGYTTVPQAWYQAIQGWWRERHGLTIEKDWLLFSTGVVPTIASVIRKLTTPGEKVLVQSPVYYVFFREILENGRRPVENKLTYEDGGYHIDFTDLEEKLADPQVSLMILCNPHNPIGRIWDRETLARMGELCRKHHVTVLSDEIHCDLTDPGCDYVPFAAVSADCAQNSITCIAPTKAFNLAGIQTSAVVVPDPLLRQKVWRALQTDQAGSPNCFAIEAAIAAFTKGGPWLDQLRAYLAENKEETRAFIARELPQLQVAPAKATYLLWLDCGKVSNDSTQLAKTLREKTGLYLTAGAGFGGNGGQFLRMNVACPKALLRDGLRRLKDGMEAL